jgi:hypothetical protein
MQFQIALLIRSDSYDIMPNIDCAQHLPVQALLHAEVPPLPQGQGETEVPAEQQRLRGSK